LGELTFLAATADEKIISDFSLSTSDSLIRRVRTVEPEAWEMMLKLYGPLVYRCARQRGLPQQDAADVVQNVFVSVWHGIQSFTLDRPDATFRGWLRTITRNAVNAHLRRQRGQTVVVMDRIDVADPHVAEDGDEEADVSAEDLFGELTHRALDLVRGSVDAATWDAFWNTTVADRPVDEVANRLNMSAAAVRQAKYRVLCRLRTLLVDR
jgi:RNA polymerase sigma-70 factor (ECF subfamily)